MSMLAAYNMQYVTATYNMERHVTATYNMERHVTATYNMERHVCNWHDMHMALFCVRYGFIPTRVSKSIYKPL